MATALRDPKISIVPIADTNLGALDKLFDEECVEWLDLLKWDYKGASTLIRDVARQRQLSGFAAIRGNIVVGFAYYVIEGWRCSIGDIYVSKSWRGSGIDRELAKTVLDQLDAVRRLRRIESQYVGLDNNEADIVFRQRGFERLERSYMVVDLGLAPEATDRTDPPDISIRAWQPKDFDQAARVIHRSYRGQHDSSINSQYQNLQGCAELLTILTDHFWCGDFLPQMSLVATRPSGALAGVLIASRVAPGVGHLGQISVHPGHQGRGIGRRMIERTLHQYGVSGYEYVSLAVTTANINAFHLYESCGFRTIHTFPVFYREKK
jgi:ribosomal protein S18 acetylase RimI-like enzyme